MRTASGDRVSTSVVPLYASHVWPKVEGSVERGEGEARRASMAVKV
jgi:hypothetical protein